MHEVIKASFLHLLLLIFFRRGGGWGIGVGGELREDLCETIPAYLNFAAAHIFLHYPKKLSYSSRNAYIEKIRARKLGNASCLLRNLKNANKLTSFFDV